MIGELVLTNDIKKLNPHILNWDIIIEEDIYKQNDINYIYGTIITSEYIHIRSLLSSINTYEYAEYDRHHYTSEQLAILDKYKKMPTIQLAFERVNYKYKKEIFSYDIFIKHIIDGLTKGNLKMSCEYKYHIPLLSDRGWFPTDFEFISWYGKEYQLQYIPLYVMANYTSHVSNRDPGYNKDESGYNYICDRYIDGYGYVEFCEDIMFKKNITAKYIMELYKKDPKYFNAIYDIKKLQILSEFAYQYRTGFKLDEYKLNMFYAILISEIMPNDIINNIKTRVLYQDKYLTDTKTHVRFTYRCYDMTPSLNQYNVNYMHACKNDEFTTSLKSYINLIEKYNNDDIVTYKEIIKQYKDYINRQFEIYDNMKIN